MENKRVFDDFPKVDCNDCARYWDSSCDGVNTGSTMHCNSFLATRSVVIPKKVERLTTVIKMLVWAFCTLTAAFITHLILYHW